MPRLSKIGAAALAAFGWTGISSVTASYLQVAGGGGGGGNAGGGAGAGGLLTGTVTLTPTLSYTVIVGAGGVGGVGGNQGVSGSNSQFGSLTASVGGGGGGQGSATGGATGGSGGGAGANSGLSGASGTAGQGNAGGSAPFGISPFPSGGGGGAGAVGGNGSGSQSGAGGVGVSSSISGASTFYAGGGGGGGTNQGSAFGAGGNGGGGAGQSGSGGTAGGFGTAGTGGGGGGSSNFLGTTIGGNGGSGIVIISYAGAQQFGGGVVTSSGGNTIHTFTSSGTLVPITPLTASYLIVAGGGGAGANNGGGSGAGGFLSGSGVTIDPNSTYLVTVGAGGIGTASTSVTGGSGSNSVFSAVATAAIGGGGGGGSAAGGANGGSGGGGGNSAGSSAFGTGTSGQGNNGGVGFQDAPNYAGGGGGGAGAVGSNAGSGSGSGVGGVGLANPITGSTAGQLVSGTYYLAGGGGAGQNTGTAGAGGFGGGGAGSVLSPGTAGTANTGGGGGGAGGSSLGDQGGSGIVIISYAGATQLMAGGTVTISGGNVIHTFTSSGYLAPIDFVGNSLRFRSSASAYLNRTLTTPTNNLKWTWSAWIKRGTLSVANVPFGAGDGSSNNFGNLQFTTSNTLQFAQINGGAYNVQMVTSAVFRDPAAWYHIQVVYDSANATSTDRVQIYVNGVRQSVTYSTGPFAQNTASKINSAIAHYISKLDYTTVYFDGYQTEVNFIDGQALTPNSFGTLNSYGVWQPITYGGSYGTNGFYLPFTNTTSTTTLGYDFSPNGNNWTTNNISLTAGATYDSMTDVPTLTSATAANYCVLNPLSNVIGGNYPTMSNGNLSAAGAGNPTHVWGTFGIAAGDTTSWYWEGVCTSLDAVRTYMGIIDPTTTTSAPGASYAFVDKAILSSTGAYFNTASGTAGGSAGTYTSYAVNDVVMVAYQNGKIWFGKNGTWMNSGNPAAGTGAIDTAVSTARTWIPYFGYNSSWTANFGQRPFSYTPPTGFVALNTYNL